MHVRCRPMAPFIAVALLVVSTFAEAQPTIVDLTGAGVAQDQFALAINESGMAVGWIMEDGITKAVSWTNGTMTRLAGFCESCPSQASGVNDLGDIAGTARRADGTRRGVLWRGGIMSALEPLPGDGESTANDINDLGEVVGSSGTGFQTRPVRWSGGMPMFLGGLDSPVGPSAANAINELGDIVGIAYANLGGRPFLWRNGVMSELDSAGATGPALDINDHATVVGTRISAGRPIATLWVDGVRSDVSSAAWSIAAGINNRGQVVGYSGATGATIAGTLWDGGAATILGGTVAYDINEAGQALGYGMVLVDGVPYAHALLFQLETPQSLLDRLLTMTTGSGPGRSLAGKVENALAAFASGDTAGACSMLNALLNEVNAQTGKKLTQVEAAAITALVERVRSLVGC